MIALAAVAGFAVGIAGVAVVASTTSSPVHPAAPPLLPGPPLAPPRTGSPAAADQAPTFPVSEDVKGGLPRLPDNGPAFRLASPSRQDVGRLAAALGLHAPVERSGDGYAVSDGDRRLQVAGDGSGPWFYTAAKGAGSGPVPLPAPAPPVGQPDGQPGAGVAGCPQPPCPTGHLCSQLCAPSRPRPADLPDRAGSERKGRAFLSQVGVDLAGAAVRVVDGWSAWTVVADPMVAGLPTAGLSSSVTVGPGGVVEMATGRLARLERLGDYPLAGVDIGLARLRSGVVLVPGAPTGADGDETTDTVDCSKPTVMCDPPVTAVTPGGAGGGLPDGTPPSPCAIPSDPGGTGKAAASCAEGTVTGSSPGSPPGSPPVTASASPVPREVVPATPGAGPAPSAVPPPSPILPAPLPPTIALTGAHLALVVVSPGTAPAGAGVGAVLEPAYVFEDGAGVELPPVPAVADRLLRLPVPAPRRPCRPHPSGRPWPAGYPSPGMFDSLSDRLETIFTRLRGRGRLGDGDVDEVLREIRLALLEADVNFRVVKSFIARVKESCVGAEVSKSLSPAQLVIKVVNQELTAVLGGQSLRITYASRPPTVVLLAGLQGSGKTTTAAKLARWFKQQGRNPLLVAADLQRPAAVEQLRVLGRQAGVPVYGDVTTPDGQPGDPVAVSAAGLAEAQRLGRDVLIVDTAGRLSIDAALMEQVRQISEATAPHYTFLVVDAMTGQDAVTVAENFHATLALDGVILTKLDGDARGGAALSVKEVIGKPIAFASTGEKLADFEAFHPDRMASRILGMGDVLTLIERAEQEYDSDVAAKAAARLKEGQFTLEDFLEQMQQVKKMGPLQGIVGMLPGVPKELKNAKIEDEEVARVEAIIRSMTPGERRDPTLINGSRRLRIANGSGVSPSEVNLLLKQFKEVQRMMGGLARLPGAGRRPGGKKKRR